MLCHLAEDMVLLPTLCESTVRGQLCLMAQDLHHGTGHVTLPEMSHPGILECNSTSANTGAVASASTDEHHVIDYAASQEFCGSPTCSVGSVRVVVLWLAA